MEAALRPFRLLSGRLTTFRVSVSVTSFDVCTDLAAPCDHAAASRAEGEGLKREPEQVPGIHLAVGEGPRGREEREDRAGPGRFPPDDGVDEEVLHDHL